ncbi:hypothetical protein CEE34_02930 [Candidatus Aerophobetes bacterium Ae_b3a]|nr:MAG: hypothetical protein CEE34_02930 [Candidatus Aerophobetes bacterium Ae_b3a]
MSEKLEEKILREISKTGFPLELRVSELLNDIGYYVANNLYYVDLDEDKGREIDLRALRNYDFKIESKQYFIRHCLLIECKKSSEKPWVIFTSPETPYDPGYLDVDCSGADFDVNIKGLQKDFDQLKNIHPFCKYERRGRSFFEPFKKNPTGEAIVKALMSTVKASIGMRDNKFASGGTSVCFFYPIVVFEGKLFEAYLNEGKIEIIKTDRLMVSFFYESPKYKNERFTIPVITEKSFGTFLNDLDAILEFWGLFAERNRKLFKDR